MLVHLAKVAIMFGLRSSGGSYEKMRSEYYLDVENPFCPQVGVLGVGFWKKKKKERKKRKENFFEDIQYDPSHHLNMIMQLFSFFCLFFCFVLFVFFSLA